MNKKGIYALDTKRQDIHNHDEQGSREVRTVQIKKR